MYEFYATGIFCSMAISLVCGYLIIPKLKKFHIGQIIREDGPQNHLGKEGTPTMGGIIFLASTLLTVLIMYRDSKTIHFLLLSTFGSGLIGFIDDFIKVRENRNLGLTAVQKMIGQALFAIMILFLKFRLDPSTEIYIPFLKLAKIDLKIFYIPFAIFVILGTANAVNLTDGLDGLASTVSIIVLAGLATINIYLNNIEIAIFSLIFAGAILGFLYFNKFPAKVFMGDSGSLAIGGAIAAIAIFSNTVLFIPILGIIFVIEALSVIIQVISVQTRNKRVFLMSPIHHHFEYKGWKETKVVLVFSIITFIATLIGIFAAL